ncbi:MAG: acyclic terpene utilization AtuA family protein, partial [bacterium]
LIGNGQGFWGDSIDAPIQLIEGGPIHYITLDYLAEVTMSIMQRQKQRDPSRGYATDFVDLMAKILPTIVEKDIKVIASAGGVNPKACREAVFDVARSLGLHGLRIGIIEGDDIFDRLPHLIKSGVQLNHKQTGQPLTELQDQILSANVYISSFALVETLEKRAQVIITGRATDPGLVLSPLIYEFGWQEDEWDKLAAGTVAGHILECGAQACGGNFTRWWQVPDYAHIGYPIIEAYSDGTFYVTKHPGTGGLVTVDTISEQIVYEMGDPQNYISPDVRVDFTTIQLEQAGKDRVKVFGIQGYPKTDSYKASISYHNGFKASGNLTISGPDAYEKAQKCAEIIWERLREAGYSFAETSTEYLGLNSCHGEITPIPDQINEVVLRLGARDADESKILRFGKELAPLITNGPPGVTGFAGGRPKPQEIIAFWPALIDKSLIKTTATVEEV